MASYKLSGLVLALCLSAPLLHAQVPSYKIHARSIAETQAEQRRLMSSWCRSDWEGSRLSADGWKKFDALTTLKHNPDFATIYVVSRYELQPADRLSWEASVSYNVIGRYEIGVGYTPQPETRVVDFRFADKEGEVQIVAMDPDQPNVSKAAFITWLKAQLETTKSDLDKLALKNALNQLQPPPPKPKPAEEGSSSSKHVN